MIKKSIFFTLFLCLNIFLLARASMTDVFQNIADQIPEGKVITITDFQGNYAEEFTNDLINYIQMHKNVSFVDYDIHRRVLETQSMYSEPVFDDKFTDTMPRLISPDIGIFGSANLQRSNLLFKQKEHFDYEINLVELSTGLILVRQNDRIQVRFNPPILLLIILIALIIAVARWVIHLKNGYNVRLIISIAMGIITLIVVWYVL
ncbi:MAG: hypothetical protein FWG98_12840 [Candidatus Cloacimonetes bacterium]|nr:hypothetical protein [Candidatus Cloacimonadota bacterium]